MVPGGRITLLGHLIASDFRFLQMLFGAFNSVNPALFESVGGNPALADLPMALPTPNPAPPVSTDGNVIDLCSAATAQNDWLRADQLAAYALQQQPNNLDAAYLKRIIDRRLGRSSP
jgi:hypothetical protein